MYTRAKQSKRNKHLNYKGLKYYNLLIEGVSPLQGFCICFIPGYNFTILAFLHNLENKATLNILQKYNAFNPLTIVHHLSLALSCQSISTFNINKIKI